MIAYSPEAEPARAFLLRRLNDLDVYVEDTSCLNMYIVLVNRILNPKGKRITHVFPLGGRDNVISRCRADQAFSARKRIYLIDGDLDLIIGRPMPRLKHLYRLKVYCAENLLISEFATITVGTESATSIGWHDMALQMSFRTLMESSVRKLAPLFVVYSIVHALGLREETTSYAVQRFLPDTRDPTTLSGNLVRKRMNYLIQRIKSKISMRQYLRKRNAISARLNAKGGLHGGLLSGKTYILPLVQAQLKRIAGFGESADKLKVRLARYCELTIDPGFRRAVLRAIK